MLRSDHDGRLHGWNGFSAFERAPSGKPSGGTRERYPVCGIVFYHVIENGLIATTKNTNTHEKRWVGSNVIRAERSEQEVAV
ncbi:hypothetical protein [uncultured Gimesia sp.]|uniref:hypothetical protein n=1 Tax=uncultured Gimesia sp. TaxID=1678688 RepID=UPI0030D7E1D4